MTEKGVKERYLITVIVSVRHPLEFPEETTAKEFPQGLRILHLKGLLYSLLCHLDDLICYEFVRKVSQ